GLNLDIGPAFMRFALAGGVAVHQHVYSETADSGETLERIDLTSGTAYISPCVGVYFLWRWVVVGAEIAGWFMPWQTQHTAIRFAGSVGVAL
ncbi:MAG TPA: hypothetical protein VKA53_08045, partial [Thermoanaerobaculia bacterium]|nr:hypothetical protein [Thermoanaerobaculia bacterium]